MVEVRQVAKGKTFTFVQVIDRETGKVGEGVSRRSKQDQFSEEIGIAIAEGRARKALFSKLNKKVIRSQFMG